MRRLNACVVAEESHASPGAARCLTGWNDDCTASSAASDEQPLLHCHASNHTCLGTIDTQHISSFSDRAQLHNIELLAWRLRVGTRTRPGVPAPRSYWVSWHGAGRVTSAWYASPAGACFGTVFRSQNWDRPSPSRRNKNSGKTKTAKKVAPVLGPENGPVFLTNPTKRSQFWDRFPGPKLGPRLGSFLVPPSARAWFGAQNGSSFGTDFRSQNWSRLRGSEVTLARVVAPMG